MKTNQTYKVQIENGTFAERKRRTEEWENDDYYGWDSVYILLNSRGYVDHFETSWDRAIVFSDEESEQLCINRGYARVLIPA